MKAKDRARLLEMVRKHGSICHFYPMDDVRFVERIVDRAVSNARRERRECPLCGFSWNPRRTKKAKGATGR